MTWVIKELKDCFFVAYDDIKGNNKVSVESFKNYFLPRVKIETYNIEIDGRNFYDGRNFFLFYEVRKVSIGQGDDYTTGYLLNFAYCEKNYRLIGADLSKQKALDVDSRAIQQIVFTGKKKASVSNTRVII